MSGLSAGIYRGVDHVHATMHAGRYFLHNGETSLASGATFDHLLRVPEGVYPHLRLLNVETTVAPARIWLYESPTVTAVGAPHTSNNVKRYSTRTPQLGIYHGPTVTLVGTTLLDGHLIPGTNQSGGIGAQSFMEWLLAPTRDYLVRIRNDGAQTATIVFAFEHYEEDHPETER